MFLYQVPEDYSWVALSRKDPGSPDSSNIRVAAQVIDMPYYDVNREGPQVVLDVFYLSGVRRETMDGFTSPLDYKCYVSRSDAEQDRGGLESQSY